MARSSSVVMSLAVLLLIIGVSLCLVVQVESLFGPPNRSDSGSVAEYRTGNTTAIHIGNTKACIAGSGDPDASSYKLCIPSWVAFTNNGTLFGKAALDHAAVSPGTAVSGFNRVHEFGIITDKSATREMELVVPHKLVDVYGRWRIQMETTGEEKEGSKDVAGILMSELKRMAEAHLGREIRNTLVTVPWHLNDHQRHLVTSATRSVAGFSTARTVGEHVAAAAAYGLHEKTRGDGKVILVFHIGGRTTHATKFMFQDGMARYFSTRHDAHLGGDDFTGRIVDHMVQLIEAKHPHGRDIRRDDAALRKLRAACESAKKTLSYREDALVHVESLLDEGVDFSEGLSRAKFEELNHDLLARVMDMAEKQLKNSIIDEIILVGGSVRIPKIAQFFSSRVAHGRRSQLITEEEAVIRGVALLTRPEYAWFTYDCHNFVNQQWRRQELVDRYY